VILKQRTGPSPDIGRLGGTIESRQDDQLVVTIPLTALAALKGDPAVRYLEQVGGTPAADESPLIGVPSDPQPGPSVRAARAENRQLRAVGDERLARTRYLWLAHPERLEGEARQSRSLSPRWPRSLSRVSIFNPLQSLMRHEYQGRVTFTRQRPILNIRACHVHASASDIEYQEGVTFTRQRHAFTRQRLILHIRAL
jgi:hypothetical protein